MRPISVLLLLAAALPAAAGGFTDAGGKPIDEGHFTIRARAWTSDQNAFVQDSEPGQDGSVIDFYDDTDLNGRTLMPWAEARFRFDEVAVRLEGWGQSDQVRGQFRSSEGFAGHVFLDGDHARFRFQAVQATAHFEWIPIDLGSEKKIGFEVGLLFGARGTRMEAEIRDSATGENFRSTAVGGGPDFGLSLTLGFLNCVEVEAWVKGMAYRFTNYDYRALDAGAEARLYVDDHFYFGGGYRYNYGEIERGKARDNGNFLEFRYFGPYVVLGLQL